MRHVIFLVMFLYCAPLAMAQGGPRIEKLLPEEEKPGATIILRGSGFSTDRKMNVVRFGDKVAKVQVCTDSSIAVAVPEGVTTCEVTVEVGGQRSNGAAFRVPGSGGEVGFLAGVEGPVQVQRTQTADWLKAVHKMPNFLLDHVKTGSKGLTCIEFLVGGRVGVDQNTEIEITGPRAVADVTKRTFLQALRVKSGAVWVRLTKQQDVFRVQTDGGVTAIRGSEVVAENRPGVDSTFWYLDGSLTYAPGEDAAAVDAPPGMKVVVVPGQAPVISKTTPQALRTEVYERFPLLSIWFPLLADRLDRPGIKVALEVSDPVADVGKIIDGTFRVTGTDRKVAVSFTNKSPQVVSIDGGDEQTVVTSGGAENVYKFKIRALTGPRNYTIVFGWELAED